MSFLLKFAAVVGLAFAAGFQGALNGFSIPFVTLGSGAIYFAIWVCFNSSRYQGAFEQAAVALWETDFSGVLSFIRPWRDESSDEFRLRLNRDPNLVSEALSRVRIKSVNPYALRLFKTEQASDLIGSLSKVFLPETYSTFGDQLVALHSGSSFFEAQSKAQTFSGDRLDIVLSVAFHGRRAEHSVVSLLDLTAQRRAENHSDEIEGRFGALFDQAPFSAQILATDGRTVGVNQAWRDLWGVPEAVVRDFILRDYNVFSDEQLKTQGILPLLNLAYAGEPVRSPAIHYDPAANRNPGRDRWVEAFVHPIKRPDGSVKEVVLFHQDVTARHEHEQEREKLVSELQSAIRARDEFLSIASHELKTPLTTLKLLVQTARLHQERKDARAFAPERMSHLVLQSERQVTRITRLVDDMLDIARISTGRLTLDIEPVDLAELVRETVQRLLPVFDESGVRVELHGSAGLIGHWDRFRLEQIVSNLLTNSLKYGARNPVNVKIERTNAESGWVRLSVQDQGIGVAPAERNRIFGRFERAVDKNEVSGLGLGLFISREIVESHGGKIWVESAGHGQGSTFFVDLPVKPPTSGDR